MAKKKRATARKKYRPTFLRQWREHRNKTQAQLGDATGKSAAQISRIETGERPYSQGFIEAAADYLETDVASLVMRDPTQPGAIWSLWDKASTGQRQDIERLAAMVVERKAG